MKEFIISILAIILLFSAFFAGVHAGHYAGYNKGKHDGVEAVYLKLRDRTIQQSEETRCLVPKA